MRYIALAILASVLGLAQEIVLEPVDPESLGDWAQVAQPLRLYPTSVRSVRYEGPSLATKLFGEISLGEAKYVILLGVNQQNEVGLWVDLNGDGVLTSSEKIPGVGVTGGFSWSVSLKAQPSGGSAYDYPFSIIWPEGRGYVFLLGGAPRRGFFGDHALVMVDGDLDGVFGTKGDFLAVDVDNDGTIYASPDGHEYFSLSEPFTIGSESFKLENITPDGLKVSLVSTAYVPPKVPLIPGFPAPDFSFGDFLSGQELSLRSFRGQVVLLDFWATWCPPCMASLPEIRKIYEEFHPLGFEIVGVSLDESATDLRRVLTQYEITWPVAFEGNRWNNSIANLYRVYQIPTTYLIDQDGIIRARDLEGDELRKILTELLKDQKAQENSAIVVSPPSAGTPVLALEAPEKIIVRPGEKFTVPLTVKNLSQYVAENVRVTVDGLPSGITGNYPDPFDLPGWETRTLALSFSAEEPMFSNPSKTVTMRVDYRYCVDEETCFDVRQEVKTELVPKRQEYLETFGSWWMWVVVAAALVVAVLLFRFPPLLLLFLWVAGPLWTWFVTFFLGAYRG